MDTTLCRCCLLRPPDKDLKTPYVRLGVGIPEVYLDMLEKCFEIHVILGGDGECGICDVCVRRLRDASDFKLQVQRSQVELQARLAVLLLKDEEPELWSEPVENRSNDVLSRREVSEEGNDGPSSAIFDDEEVKSETAEDETSEVSRAEVISEPGSYRTSGDLLDDEEVKSETADGETSEVSRPEVVSEPGNDGTSGDMLDEEEVKSETAEGGTSEVSRAERMSEPSSDGTSGDMLDDEVKSETAEGGASAASLPEVASEPSNDGTSGDVPGDEPEVKSEASEAVASAVPRPDDPEVVSKPGNVGPSGDMSDDGPEVKSETTEGVASELPRPDHPDVISETGNNVTSGDMSDEEPPMKSEGEDDRTNEDVASHEEAGGSPEPRAAGSDGGGAPQSICGEYHPRGDRWDHTYARTDPSPEAGLGAEPARPVSARAREKLALACSVRLERLDLLYSTSNAESKHKSAPKHRDEQGSENHTEEKSYLASPIVTHPEENALNSDLSVHLNITRHRQFFCDICNEGFPYKYLLIKHLQTHRQEKIHAPETIKKDVINNLSNNERYPCDICRKLFARKLNLRSHVLAVHFGEKPYVCELCDKRFGHQACLYRHVKSHTKEKRFYCDICKKGFPYKNILRKHMRKHGPEYLHPPDSQQSELVDDIYKVQWQPKENLRGTYSRSHIMAIHSEEKSYACKICAKRFGHQSSVYRHMKLHTKKQFHCDICNEGFSFKNILIKHMTKHGPEYHHRPDTYQSEFVDDMCKKQWTPKENLSGSHICAICNRVFARKSYLKTHMVIHSEEKAYECKICGKQFRHRSAVYRHIKTHDIYKKGFGCKFILYKNMPIRKAYLEQTGETTTSRSKTPLGSKPFSCDVCNKAFGQKSYLRTHIIAIHSGKKPYACEICDKRFGHQSNLYRHMKTHTKEKRFYCDICNKGFPFKYVLKRHLTKQGPRHHLSRETNQSQEGICKKLEDFTFAQKPNLDSEEMAYQCEVCGIRLRHQASLYEHRKSHTSKKRFFCDICKKGFVYTYLLKRHMHIHPEYLVSPERYQSQFAYACDMCNITFPQKSDLGSHIMAIHSEEKSYACKICDRRFLHQSNVYRHMKTHTKEKRFYCDICNKGFPYKYILIKHMTKHGPEYHHSLETYQSELRKKQLQSKENLIASHICAICNKVFARKSYLRTHMVIHSEEKAYECKVCGKQFRHNSSLWRHVKIHDICKKDFSYKFILKKNLPKQREQTTTFRSKSPERSKPFSCDICNEAFALKSSLKQHMYIHSDEKTYECELCGKRFRHQANVITHLKIHTKEKRVFCDICKKGFAFKYILKRHMTKHGPEYLVPPDTHQSEFVDDIYKKQWQPKENLNGTYSCDICNIKLKNKSYLTQHLRIVHARKKPYSCEVCLKLFALESNLYVHLKSHTEGTTTSRTKSPIGSKPFSCDVCNEAFAQKSSLKQHIYTHSVEKTYEYECQVCGKRFRQQARLYAHRKKHTKEKRFFCDICKKGFAYRYVLKRHITKHRPGSYICDICDKGFAQKSYLKTHMVIHSEEKAYQCELCGKRFRHQANVITHLKIHTKEKRVFCDICKKGFAFKYILKRHMTKHGPEYLVPPDTHQCEFVDDIYKKQWQPKENLKGTYSCDICNKKLKYKSYLTQHLRIVHARIKPYSCEVCLKLFALESNLYVHLKSHTEGTTTSRTKSPIGSKPFSCDVCNEAFAQKSSLKQHIYTHSVVKTYEYECQVCGKRFRQQARLYAHRKKHTKEKRFFCDICKKGFAYRYVLKRHITKHRPASYICDICDKGFAQKSYLKTHMVIHSEEKAYECKLCGKQFRHQSGVCRHVQTHDDIFKKGLDYTFILNKNMSIRKAYLKQTEETTTSRSKTPIGSKPFSCDVCNKAFAQKSNLKSHIIAIHSGKKPYACEICDKRFGHQSNLCRHMKSHTKEKRFYCSICNKGFPFKHVLKRHLTKHGQHYLQSRETNQSQEEICKKQENFTFAQKPHLQQHVYVHSEEKAYGCEVCGIRFRQQSNLYNHMKIHTKEKRFFCDICKKGFVYKYVLKKHMTTHGPEYFATPETCQSEFVNDIFKYQWHPKENLRGTDSCDICNKQFTREEYLRRHLRTVHARQETYSCEICLKQFALKGTLNVHLKSHAEDSRTNSQIESKPFSCDVCNKAFTQKSNLKTHIIAIHSGKKLYACEICDKRFGHQSNLYRHMKTHTEEMRFYCDICNKGFPYKYVLKRHLTKHGQHYLQSRETNQKQEEDFTPTQTVMPHCCEKCGKRFKSKKYFTAHMNRHLGLEQHFCKLCNKRFTWFQSLKNHIRLHEEAKPYACEICHKRFSRKLILRTHMMIHSGVKPHSCNICNKPFRAKNALNSHIRRIHTGEKPYACHICHREFAERKELKWHHSTHATEKPYACGICFKKFPIRTNSLTSGGLKISLALCSHQFFNAIFGTY